MFISLVPSYGSVFFPTLLFCNFRFWTLASFFVDLGRFWRRSLFFIHRKISAAVLLIICPKNLGRVKKCEVITMMATRQDKSARSCSVYDLLLFGDDDKADFRLQYVMS